jgi:hypothetical protein
MTGHVSLDMARRLQEAGGEMERGNEYGSD